MDGADEATLSVDGKVTSDLCYTIFTYLSLTIIPGDDLPAGLCPVCGGGAVRILPLSRVPDRTHQALCRGRHGAGRVQRMYSRISQSSIIIFQRVGALWSQARAEIE